jgi:ssDNA-binding protein
MAQRQYEAATVFNARIADMRHLWTPSTIYKGQPTTKPNYFAMFLVKKTVAQWFREPALAGVSTACGKIYQNNPHILAWPVVDGDVPSPEGKSSEFAQGHWLFSASSGNPPNVEIVQTGGVLTKLTNKVGVKSGDYVMVGVTAAVKQNDPRGVKLYLNAVVFSGPGEEIVFANSVSGAELMRMAEQQGLRPAGFSPSLGGFAPPQGQPFGQPGGFTPPAGGFAPPMNGPAPQGAQAPSGPGFGGPAGTTFPSNPFAPR